MMAAYGQQYPLNRSPQPQYMGSPVSASHYHAHMHAQANMGLPPPLSLSPSAATDTSAVTRSHASQSLTADSAAAPDARMDSPIMAAVYYNCVTGLYGIRAAHAEPSIDWPPHTAHGSADTLKADM